MNGTVSQPVLYTIYRDVFDENFDPAAKDHRIKMQNMVYMLQESGIDLGYTFHWYSCGVYSLDLQDDISTRKGSGGGLSYRRSDHGQAVPASLLHTICHDVSE